MTGRRVNGAASSPGASARRAEPVASITSVGPSLAADQAKRTRAYLIQMGIRVLCIIGAVVAARSWLMWVLLAAAVVLPYTAVLFANAGRDQTPLTASPLAPLRLGDARGAAHFREEVSSSDGDTTATSVDSTAPIRKEDL